MALHRTQKMNFPNSFLIIIESLYTNATSKILINGHLTKPIKMEKGIRQSGPFKFIFVFISSELFGNTNPKRLNYTGHQNPRKAHCEKRELR